MPNTNGEFDDNPFDNANETGENIEKDVNYLTYGQPNVYRMSVKDNNAGVADINDWIGVTVHDDPYSDANILTYNLLIGIKAGNWGRQYIARAYVTYEYNGVQYTVYDGAAQLAQRSVFQVAYAILIAYDDSTSPATYMGCYLRNKIVVNVLDTSKVGGYGKIEYYNYPEERPLEEDIYI